MLIIPFDDDRAKNIELHLSVLMERKNIFLAWLISARQRGAVMAFMRVWMAGSGIHYSLKI